VPAAQVEARVAQVEALAAPVEVLVAQVAARVEVLAAQVEARAAVERRAEEGWAEVSTAVKRADRERTAQASARAMAPVATCRAMRNRSRSVRVA
jgi:hypothetical protein